MATTKKGKKSPKPAKGAKPKKKNKKNDIGIFSKIILTILLITVLTIGGMMILKTIKNIPSDENDNTEIKVKKETDNVTQTTASVNDIIENTEKKKIDDTEKKTQTEKNEVIEESPKKESTQTEITATNEQVAADTNMKKSFKDEKKISGCWLSSEQGASLTIDDYGYRIDFFGVDASKPMTGDYRIENNLIVFSSDGSDCKGINGSYRITFYKKNISLICKDDKCSSRRNILEADWEWMEI